MPRIYSRINRYVDFTVVEIEEGGASVHHLQKEEVQPFLIQNHWTNDRERIVDWVQNSEPGDMTNFQSGWIFHRIPK